MKLFILEIGRPIKNAVISQFKQEPDEVLSIPRAISELEIPEIVSLAYKMIMKLAENGEEVHIVLSGPLALSFQLGQAVGLGHAKIIVWQFSAGQYRKVPPLTREHLFQT